MGWVYAILLAAAVVVLVLAEWPRLSERLGVDARRTRARAKQKGSLTLVQTESEEFAATVERDLSRLPTIEERNGKR